MNSDANRVVPELPGQRISLEAVGDFTDSQGDDDKILMYYDGTLVWLVEAFNGMRGIALWHDFSTDYKGRCDYKHVRYLMFLYDEDGYNYMRSHVVDGNQPMLGHLKNADVIYAVDVCEYQNYEILGVKIVRYEDLNHEFLPKPGATIFTEAPNGNEAAYY